MHPLFYYETKVLNVGVYNFTCMHARTTRGPHVIVSVETFYCHCTLTGIFPSFSSFAVIVCLMSYTLVSCTRPTRATLQLGLVTVEYFARSCDAFIWNMGKPITTQLVTANHDVGS